MHRRTLLAAVAASCSPHALALHDPKPNPLLATATGSWTGTLTYRDWNSPDKMVTLPCKLAIALSAPESLSLFYVFDDGPGHVVYSYERMAFDFQAGSLVWVSGITRPETGEYVITGTTPTADGGQVLFERAVEGRTDKYTLSLGQDALSLGKVEVAASGAQTLRHRYAFRRGDA